MLACVDMYICNVCTLQELYSKHCALSIVICMLYGIPECITYKHKIIRHDIGDLYIQSKFGRYLVKGIVQSIVHVVAKYVARSIAKSKEAKSDVVATLNENMKAVTQLMAIVVHEGRIKVV